MFRKLMVIALAITLGLGLTGMATAKTIKIGVAWQGKSGMANRVLKGLVMGLKEKAPHIQVELKADLATMADLAKVAAGFQKDKAAMVILRSNGATWLGKNPPKIPAFIGGCNNPVILGAVKNMAAPEGNITGVTYYLPLKTPFEVFKNIVPGLKSVLLLNDKNHPGTPIDVKGTTGICARMGIKLTVKLVTSKAEALAVVKAVAGKVSAIIIGNTALVIDNAKAIVAAAGLTPVLSYSSGPVKDGALGGFVADDVKLGWLLSRSVIDVLVNQKPIKAVPIKTDPKPKFYLNATTAERLKLKIPFEITQMATIVK